jgi:hypothetical protein
MAFDPSGKCDLRKGKTMAGTAAQAGKTGRRSKPRYEWK